MPSDQSQQEQPKQSAPVTPDEQPAKPPKPAGANNFVASMLELEKKSKEEKVPLSKVIKLYVVPIVTLALFTGIILFLVLPAVNTLFSNLDSVSNLGQEVGELDSQISDLQTLQANISQVQSDLDAINAIVPTGKTEVTVFQQKIISLARQNGVTVVEADTVEQVFQTGENDVAALGIIEIPNNFNIQGSLANLQSFVRALQTVDDFVIVGEMELRAETNFADLWNLDLLLIKYQFQQPDENNNLLQAYARVPATADADPEVLEIIRR